jgi:hypothetical protein
MVQLCSIEQAVDDVLARLPAHIHMGLPLGWASPITSSTRCTGVSRLPERR